MKHIHLRIIGMRCGACAEHVARALRGVGGVSEASVDLLGETAWVASASASLSGEQLLPAVRAAGYDAEVIAPGSLGADRTAREADQQPGSHGHWRALATVLILVVPILGLEYTRTWLWSSAPESQMACRVLQLLALVLLAAGPAGAPVLAGGLRALWHRTGNMDLLITLGVTVAFSSSVYGTFVAREDAFIHYHAAAMILGLVTIGRVLEARAKARASAAMSVLARRAPKTALVRRDGDWVSLPLDQIAKGDVVKVPVHASIPTDGVVAEGEAAVDEGLMTGEAMPLRRGVGDRVLGGTVVTEGVLTVRAAQPAGQSALGRMLRMVQQAQASRTEMQRLADRVAAVFTPVVLGVAAVTFACWLAIGGRDAAAEAARSAIAVLVVACPCALGLATPTVVSVGMGLAALRGILVRDAGMLEAMGQVDVVVWDKTGTLTGGAPSVESVTAIGDQDPRAVLRLAAGAERLSTHPVAKAIVAQARREAVGLPEAESFESVPGRGVAAVVDGVKVAVGSVRFLRERGVETQAAAGEIDRSGPHAETVVVVGLDGRAAGVIRVRDAVRPSAASAVRRLEGLGVRSEMLTGDALQVARSVAQQVGIRDVHAEADPGGKVEHVRALRRQGLRVAMVGDGVNDAAALAAADVGIAFAAGAELACEAAGIQLVGSTPHAVADAVTLAKAGVRIIRENLFWAFAYNVLMIPLAALGLLPPVVAAGAMMASSLTVVFNALRLPRVTRWSAGASVSKAKPGSLEQEDPRGETP